MFNKNKLLIVLGVVFIGVIVFFYLQKSWQNEIKNYEGDGEIKLLDSGGFFKGYEIALEKLPLNKKYSANYKVRKAPNLEKTIMISFRILCECTAQKNKDAIIDMFKDAYIFVKVNSVKGDSLFSVKSQLKEWKNVLHDNSMAIDFYYLTTEKTSLIKYDVHKNNDLDIYFEFLPKIAQKNTADYHGGLVISSGGFK